MVGHGQRHQIFRGDAPARHHAALGHLRDIAVLADVSYGVVFQAKTKRIPPSSTEEELAEHGVNIVIYANQLTRAAFPAMQNTAIDILKHHRAKEVDDQLMPIKEIITLIDTL